ncbi:helix-turn-helix DNA-binding domain protein [Arthrobacter phage Kumotta]|uniref:Helix-turn-helix DNA-binding domain protein n=2 Tax=Kumottavirus TaxID=3044749 RepID=A0A4Y6EPQ6_9CAUD|nr:helix-turn-helix DNA-binding domain protein [Arthrobacter phage Kumotta]YP_010649513.1 helix-turn-helix DNA binding domain protein [Arthrobacter phage MargaretKali]AXH44411.1 helix-turn-helix DNA binding domain protein [Arthrobacter phage MargaretKali]QDF19541.1 helix-turn-helix DNA-binding domain protein [Arthrobacter phage Kumotta]
MSVPASKQAESGQLARAFSAELRAALARRRISAKQFALSIGMTPAYLNKRLRDEAPFTLNDVEAIIKKMGADWDGVAQTAIETLRSASEPDGDHDS